MLFKCYGYNFIEVRIYIYICMYIYVCIHICKVILFLQKSVKCECKEKQKSWSVNARKWKSGEKGSVIFLPQSYTYPTPIVHSPYLILLPQKSSPYPIFLAASDQKVQPSFPTPFSLFLLSSLFALTRQPSLFHQSKISLSKEEI